MITIPRSVCIDLGRALNKEWVVGNGIGGFASGTVTGPAREQRGSFLELSWGGQEPFDVGGETRTFLEDGDEVVLSATAPGPAGKRIGFGEVRGRIVPG